MSKNTKSSEFSLRSQPFDRPVSNSPEKKPILEGESFGLEGPYEKVSGKLRFAIDAKNSANRMIADIDEAPRNDQGEIEFSSDFFLLQPAEPGRGNKAVLFEVSNRGGKGMLVFLTSPEAVSIRKTNLISETGILKNATRHLDYRAASAQR